MNGFLILIIVAVICVLSFLIVRVFINNTVNNAPEPTPSPESDSMILKITVPSGGSNFELPFTFSSGESITVDWGDGSTEIFSSEPILHTYSGNEVDYTITIKGKATSYGKINYTGVNMITEVVSWGTLGLTSLAFSFAVATNLVKVPNTIPSTVTDLTGMFSYASNFNQDLDGWDTKNVTNMSGVFSGCTIFNGNISNWDTKKVTNMAAMFGETTVFNKPLNFDTSNVTNMQGMFLRATAFNRPLNFDTSKVTNMSYMFQRAAIFNQPLTFNDTSSVTDMRSMFDRAEVFDQDLSSWNNLPVLTDAQNIFNKSAILGKYSKYPAFNTSQILPGPPPNSDPYYGSP